MGTDYSCSSETLLSSRSRAILSLLAVTEVCSFSFKERACTPTIRCAPLEFSSISTLEAIERFLSSLDIGVNVYVFVMNSLLEFKNSENGTFLMKYLKSLSDDGRAIVEESPQIFQNKTLSKLLLSCIARYRLFGNRADDSENVDLLNVSGWRRGEFLNNNTDIPLNSPLQHTSSKIHRIGIFGGSFNPITIGHLDLISGISQFSVNKGDQQPFLDEVWIVPCGPRPDKPSANKVSAALRYAMCVMGIEEYFSLSVLGLSEHDVKKRSRIRAMPFEVDEGIALSSRELFLRLKSTFSKNPGTKVEFHLIVGSDLIPSLPLWRSSQELMQEVPFIFVPRSGYAIEISQSSLLFEHELSGTISEKLPRSFKIASSVQPQDASSTTVRKVASEAFHLGMAPNDIQARLSTLVPSCVASIITENKLYLE